MIGPKSLIGAAAISALMAGAPAAIAKGGDVRVAGTCSAASASKLKLASRDGLIQTEFEVDQNRVGQVWSWTLKDNGVTVASGRATTVAPSGSFTVRRNLADRAGTDTIVAAATNAATGERCTATARI
jgi:hypothetical protein